MLLSHPPRAGKCCLIPVDTLVTAREVGPALPVPSLGDTTLAATCLCLQILQALSTGLSHQGSIFLTILTYYAHALVEGVKWLLRNISNRCKYEHQIVQKSSQLLFSEGVIARRDGCLTHTASCVLGCDRRIRRQDLMGGGISLPGESRGQRSLAGYGYGPQGHRESDTTEQACTHLLGGNEELRSLHPPHACSVCVTISLFKNLSKQRPKEIS